MALLIGLPFRDLVRIDTVALADPSHFLVKVVGVGEDEHVGSI